jgi:hypothetical protein
MVFSAQMAVDALTFSLSSLTGNSGRTGDVEDEIGRRGEGEAGAKERLVDAPNQTAGYARIDVAVGDDYVTVIE